MGNVGFAAWWLVICSYLLWTFESAFICYMGRAGVGAGKDMSISFRICRFQL